MLRTATLRLAALPLSLLLVIAITFAALRLAELLDRYLPRPWSPVDPAAHWALAKHLFQD